jgi:hypothetical protein
VFGSAGATSGCYVDPPGWPGYGQAHCGDPVHLSELRFFVEIGVQLIPFGDGEYQGLLSFSSEDPADWHYQDEPDNPHSASLFDPNLVTTANINAVFSGWNKIGILARLTLTPWSYYEARR